MNWTSSAEGIKVAVRVVAVLGAYAIARSSGLHQLTAREVEGLNTLILLLGSIYGVILAFAIFVIWGQFSEVENCIMRECNSLHDILRFSSYLNADASHDIRRGVADYCQHVAKFEWAALGDGRRDKRADQTFGELVDAVVKANPADPAERTVYIRLIDMARKAGEHRDERVTKSLTRMPQTLLWFVNTIAAVLLLLVFCYPFHHWATGGAGFLLVAFVLILADVVMKDMDNPMRGLWNVSPRPFQELPQ
jgi:hypothetical protein